VRYECKTNVWVNPIIGEDFLLFGPGCGFWEKGMAEKKQPRLTPKFVKKCKKMQKNVKKCQK
jgi:hypothetical protein